MKKSSLAVFAFALLAAAAPFAALLVPPAAPTPPTDSVQADDLSPAATPQPLPTMPPSNAQNGTTVPDAALAAADITLYAVSYTHLAAFPDSIPFMVDRRSKFFGFFQFSIINIFHRTI